MYSTPENRGAVWRAWQWKHHVCATWCGVPGVATGGVARRMERPLVKWRARSAVALAIEDWQMVWRYGCSGRRCGVTDGAAIGVMAYAVTYTISCAMACAMACTMAYAV